MGNLSKENVVLGFDFGTKRIGVAVGQVITKSASPLCGIKTKAGVPEWEKIKQLKNEWNVDAFVVGMPYNMDGSEQTITRSAQQFGNRLKRIFQLPVYFVDERLTTKEALWSLQQAKEKKYLRKNKNIDSLAAKIILESFFRLNNNRGSM